MWHDSVLRFISRLYYFRPFRLQPQPPSSRLLTVVDDDDSHTTVRNMDTSASAHIPAATSPPYSIPFPSGSCSWLYTTLAIMFTLLALEQSIYRYKKRHLPGATWTIPIIGKFADSLKPTMEGYMRQWNAGDLSAVSVFNMYVHNSIYCASVFVEANLHVVSSSWPLPTSIRAKSSTLQHTLSPVWFMPPNKSSSLITGKSPQFSRRAPFVLTTRVSGCSSPARNTWHTVKRSMSFSLAKLLGPFRLFVRVKQFCSDIPHSLYFDIQVKVTREHFRNWVTPDGKAQPLMMIARHLNMDTSLRVFCGDHIPAAATQEISDKYWDITRALELVNFPLALPGTKIWRAIQARKVAFKWLVEASAKSKIHMANGGETTCMLDGWLKTIQDPEWKGRKEFSDREMAMVVFSFLFASQDAMSSGLIYAFQHLANHPEVFAKVREEQDRVRGDSGNPMTLEIFNEMPYLGAVVKESLRVKPPVLMVIIISPLFAHEMAHMIIPGSLQDHSCFPYLR